MHFTKGNTTGFEQLNINYMPFQFIIYLAQLLTKYNLTRFDFAPELSQFSL